MKDQKVRTNFTSERFDLKNGHVVKGLRLGGWLSKDRPFLRIADQDDNYLAGLTGAPLYRLAKAIVARFEAEK